MSGSRNSDSSSPDFPRSKDPEVFKELKINLTVQPNFSVCEITTQFCLALFYYLAHTSYAALDIVITEGVDVARPVAIIPFQYVGSRQLPPDLPMS